jgi:hypothetical protein
MHTEYPSRGTDAAIDFPRAGITRAEFSAEFHEDKPGEWPGDGQHAKPHHQQYHDHIRSKHYRKPFYLLACDTCNDSHDRPLLPGRGACLRKAGRAIGERGQQRGARGAAMSTSCAPTDLTGRRIAWLLWGGPLLLLVIGAFVDASARAFLWTPALLVAGVACVANAARCHRRHCYLTGPLFLGAAAVTVLRGLEILAVPWAWIGAGIAGGTTLAHVPEWIGGKYAGGRRRRNERR